MERSASRKTMLKRPAAAEAACKACSGDLTQKPHLRHTCAKSFKQRRILEAEEGNDYVPKVDTFPWKVSDAKELQLEFKQLESNVEELQAIGLKTGAIEHPFPCEKKGNLCSNAFFQFERMRTKRGPTLNRLSSAWNYWYEHSEKIKKKTKDRNKKSYTCLMQLVFEMHPPGQFPVLTAVRLYQYFKATKVFDPYAGWGDRCAAAMAMRIDYVGVDSNPNLMVPFQQMMRAYATTSVSGPCSSEITVYVGHKSQDVLKNGGAPGAVCSRRGKGLSAKQSAAAFEAFKLEESDLVFCSPPFWKTNGFILERYSECEVSYDTFMKESLIPVVRKCLNTRRRVSKDRAQSRKPPATSSSTPGGSWQACSVDKRFRWVCLHLPEIGPMYPDLVKEFGECNLKLQFRARTSPAKYDTIYCWNSGCASTWKRCPNPLKVKTLCRDATIVSASGSSSIKSKKLRAIKKTQKSKSRAKVSINNSMDKLRKMAEKGQLTCRACLLLVIGTVPAKCGTHTRQQGCVGF